MSRTTIYPWGRNRPPYQFETSDQTYRRFKSICAYKGIPMKQQIHTITVQYAESMGIQEQDPFEAFRKACDATNSAMIRQVHALMEDFIKNKRMR